MLALYIAMSLGLDRPYWAMASVYIASQPLSGATRSKAVYRLCATLIGAAAAVVLVPAISDAPPLLSLVLALWVAACLYLSLLDRTPRSYVCMLAVDGVEINLLASHLSYDATAWETRHFGLLRARMIMLIPVLASIADRIAALGPRLPREAAELTADLAAWVRALAPGSAEPLAARIA